MMWVDDSRMLAATFAMFGIAARGYSNIARVATSNGGSGGVCL